MKNRILFLLGLLTSFIAMPIAQAATVIQEPFSGPAPGSNMPLDWYATNTEGVDFASSGKTRLRIFRGSGTGGNSAIYYTGTKGDVKSGQIRDFEAELTLRLGGSGVPSSSMRGVVFRTQTLDLSAPTGTTGFWGYSVGVITTGANMGLYLFENPTGASSSGNGQQLAFDALSIALLNNVDYTLKVVAEGAHLEASLFGSGNELLAHIVYGNAVIQEGYFGLRAIHPNTNVNTYFSDLTLTVAAVPEASTTALLSLCLAGATLFVGGRRLFTVVPDFTLLNR